MIIRVKEYVLRGYEDSHHHIGTSKTDQQVVHGVSHRPVTQNNEADHGVTNEVYCHKQRKGDAKTDLCRFGVCE